MGGDQLEEGRKEGRYGERERERNRKKRLLYSPLLQCYSYKLYTLILTCFFFCPGNNAHCTWPHPRVRFPCRWPGQVPDVNYIKLIIVFHGGEGGSSTSLPSEGGDGGGGGATSCNACLIGS